jgi:hypothetical protein
MTAEVVVMNKFAAALAADSAVTIDSGGTEKIYNSVDKIFELNERHPVGMMINGGIEFMGIPLSTLVKLYRSERRGGPQPTITAYVDDFLTYLSSELRISDKDKSDNLRRVLYSLYSEVWGEVVERSRRIFEKESKFSRPKFNNSALLPILRRYVRELGEKDQLITLPTSKVNALCKVHSTEHAAALRDVIGEWKLIREARGLFDKLCGLAITRAYFSPFSTGLVFAGFGQDEIFPAMQSVEIEGILCDKLKVHKSPAAEIVNIPVGAHVVPFAQHEMVDRFLDGVDPRYDRYLRTGIRRVIQDFGDELIEQHLSGTERDKLHAKTRMRIRRTLVVNEFFERAKKFKEDRFRAGILDMVRFMPKQELAQMAESLVNLTTIKRHVSAEKETVGGPIDIAMISKSEGFVWIKRKHYFDKEFNQRYFVRQFGSVAT